MSVIAAWRKRVGGRMSARWSGAEGAARMR